MRSSIHTLSVTPPCPLLDAADLPGAEDWSLIESLHCDGLDADDDRLATLSIARDRDA